MNDTSMEKGRGEIDDLLPWYANGRLAAADRARVEAALAADPELARRLEIVREERAEAIAANEALSPTSSRAFDRLMAAIDAEPAPARPFAAMKAGLLERFGDFLAGLAPRRLAYAAAAVVAVVALQSLAIGGLIGRGGTAGGPMTTASQGETAGAGPTLLVAFAPEARIDEIAALLKANGAGIAEGPKAGGMFRLRLVEGADAAAVAAKLAAEPRIVVFAQPAP